jgi:hypothetical protein
MSKAGHELQAKVIEVLGGVAGLGTYSLAPVQAAYPFATMDAGLETDWSHKSGDGREVRLAVTIRDKSERPERVQQLEAQAEAAIAGISGATANWSVVSMSFMRSRLVREKETGWAAVIEYRARMLRL